MSETIERGPLQITMLYDEDSEDPRDWDSKFLWLGFPHRNYDIGDERLDPSGIEETCPVCDGEGRDTSKDIEPIYEGGGWVDGIYQSTVCIQIGVNGPDCPACEGNGYTSPSDLAELCEYVKRTYQARLVVPVGMIDHSGVSYYLGGGAHWCDPGGWDSGTCGLMVATEAQLKEWGIPDMSDDDLRKQMSAELEEYTSWANGDVWWYEITRNPDVEPTDDETDVWMYEVANSATTLGLSEWLEARFLNAHPDNVCGGFIGYEYAESEAIAEADRIIKAMETPCMTP